MQILLYCPGMRSLIIGTAGHIDHGKTSLVKALTGTDTDRLKEEKARGITIELGFAHLKLSESLQAGIVDVPGHERFVKNMVAGTTGIDMVLLVVAADEGVMPQTREHLDICTLLGVERGLVALTKTDLTNDPQWLEMVSEDLAGELAGTFLEECPVVRVSARTGEGLDQLVKELADLGKTIEPRPRDAPAFLGVDRAFSMHGFGTVVTGTLVSGSLQVDDIVDVLPDPSTKLRGLKIRGLQVHGDDVNKAEPGNRVAVNLSGIERSLLARGQAIAHNDTLRAGQNFECHLRLVPGAKPARSRTRAIFHTGTAKSMATVHLIDREILRPGEAAYANIHCEEPLVALPGHRYILRGFTAIADRGTTSGGGKIVTILPPRRRRREKSSWHAELSTLDKGSLGERLQVLLRQAGLAGAGVPELRMRAASGTKSVNRELDKLMAERLALKYDREQNRFVEATVLADLTGKAEEILADFHKNNPLLPGIPAEQLRTTLSYQLDARLFRLLMDELAKSNRAVQVGDVIRLCTHRVRLDEDETKLTREVRRMYDQAALAPPRIDEVAQDLKRPEPEILDLIKHLTRTGGLTHISKDMYVATQALDDLRARLVEHLQQHGEITTQAFKSMVGGTRKHVIPLAEFFDQEKTTLRVGEKRVLRRKTAGSDGG